MLRTLAFFALLAACGDSTSVTVDAVVIDVPLAVIDAPPTPGPDAPPEADASPSLGQLCVTSTYDGGPGSCPSSETCCTSTIPYVCRLASDCPGGTGYKQCGGGSCCQGAICCQLPSMTFCTKHNVCDSYGGTVIACP